MIELIRYIMRESRRAEAARLAKALDLKHRRGLDAALIIDKLARL